MNRGNPEWSSAVAIEIDVCRANVHVRTPDHVLKRPFVAAAMDKKTGMIIALNISVASDKEAVLGLLTKLKGGT